MVVLSGGSRALESEVGLQICATLGIEPRSCTYLSTPITSGPAFIRWKQSLGDQVREEDRQYWRDHRLNVIAENETRIAPIERRLRKEVSGVLVSPIHLHISGWSQLEYHRFWQEFISQWCAAVVFSEGWEFSTGCCVEALTSVVHGLRLFDQDLADLTPSKMATSLESARRDLIEIDMANAVYLETVESLLQLVKTSSE